MKATIRDPEALAALKPLEVTAYLRSKGWTKSIESSGKWSTWTLCQAGDEFEVALPLSDQLRDFALRMSDVLQILEAVEERSQLEILRDLFLTTADVIRVRLIDAEFDDGTMPLVDGANVFPSARDMMLAAASAAVNPQGYYPSRRPQEAVDYLRRVRFGQTERGSFVLTIVSKVQPRLTSSPGALFDTSHIDEPFDRKVTQTLAKSLDAVRRSAESAVATGDPSSARNAVKLGVSANLCDALVGLSRADDYPRTLEFDFTWSATRSIRPGSGVPSRIHLMSDAMPVLQEISRLFKETTPREEFDVLGPVIRLERDEGEVGGRVTILGFVDDQPRKLLLELDDTEYEQAVLAHKNQYPVYCHGTLRKMGRSFRLEDVSGLGVLSDDE